MLLPPNEAGLAGAGPERDLVGPAAAGVTTAAAFSAARPQARPRASVPGRSSGAPPRSPAGGPPPGGSGPAKPLTPAAPPPPPSKKRRTIALAATAVVVIGVVVTLVVALTGRGGSATDPKPTLSGQPSITAPSSTPSTTPTESTPSATDAPSSEPSDGPTSTEPVPATPSIDPAVEPYLKYCQTFYTNGPAIREASHSIMGFKPPDGFAPEDPAQVWAVVNKVTTAIGPVLNLIDQSLAAGPPDAMYTGLANARNQFQLLYDAFAAVNPDTDPTAYTGKLLNASRIPTEEMQNSLSAQVEEVGKQTEDFCPPPEWLSQYHG